jgi:hypothetical protein
MAEKKVEFPMEASREALASFEWYFARGELVAREFSREL